MSIILKKDRICAENMKHGIFSGEGKTAKGVCLVSEAVYFLQRAEKNSYWLVDLSGEYVKDGKALVTITDAQAAGARQRYFDTMKAQIINQKEQEIYISLVQKIKKEVDAFLNNVDATHRQAYGVAFIHIDAPQAPAVAALTHWLNKETAGSAANLRAQAWFIDNPTVLAAATKVHALQQACEWDALWGMFHGAEVATLDFNVNPVAYVKHILSDPAVGHIRLCDIAKFQTQKLL